MIATHVITFYVHMLQCWHNLNCYFFHWILSKFHWKRIRDINQKVKCWTCLKCHYFFHCKSEKAHIRPFKKMYYTYVWFTILVGPSYVGWLDWKHFLLRQWSLSNLFWISYIDRDVKFLHLHFCNFDVCRIFYSSIEKSSNNNLHNDLISLAIMLKRS